MVRTRAAVLIAAAAGVLLTALLAAGVPDTLELPVRDSLLRTLPIETAASTVIVAIDEPSLRAIGPWPWSRPVIASIVNRIADSGARGIVLDVLLADARDGDEELGRALRRIPAITIAAIGDNGEWLLPVAPVRAASTVAHGNFELDHDGIVRRLATTKQSGDRALTAVCIEAASIVKPLTVAPGYAVLPAFRTPPRAIPIVSAAALVERNSPLLRGRIAFVGPIATALGDRVLTPVSRLPEPGVTVHAAATESLIRGERIHNVAPIVSGLIAAIFMAVLLLIRSRTARWIAAGAIVLLTLGGAALLVASTGTSVPIVTLTASAVATVAAIEVRAVTASLRQSSAAAARIESGLGLPPHTQDREVGPRLEEIATRLAEVRAKDLESKRVLAHELKTPLASMRGLSQLLSGFELNDGERRRVASLLESETGKLEAMVAGLLDLERLPLRDFRTSTTVIDLGDVVRRRIEFLRASTERAISMSIGEEAFVRGDAALLDRVIDNLVGNALKYTNGPVSVRVRRFEGSAAIEIEDRGPGIGDAERERIFQRFVRGATAGGTPGLGLGLALVAEIARWHGGIAMVDSATSGGSIFRFALPLEMVARSRGDEVAGNAEARMVTSQSRDPEGI